MAGFASALTLSACGGAGGKKDGESAEPATRSAEATQEPAALRAPERDGAIADAGLLTVDDVLAGWRAGRRVPPPGVSGCESVNEVIDSASEIGRSRQLTDRGGGSTVSNVVLVFGDDAAAERAFDTLMGDESQRCIAKSFRDEIAAVAKRSGVRVSGFTHREIAMDPIGSESRVFLSRTNVAGGGERYAVFIQNSVARVGRALTVMRTRTLGPARQIVVRGVLGSSVRRIENALIDE
jgi:hypothetical protein